MRKPISSIASFTRRCMLALAVTTLPLAMHASAEEAAAGEASVRAMALEIQAVVRDVDLETRQVTLEAPGGELVTIHATEQVVKLEDVSVGDVLVVTYLRALEGELRAPTEEELAEPWVELEEGMVSDDAKHPGVAGARAVRAVVTIEGMNRILGTVTVLDARGKLHVIGAVEPEKMEGVTLGQTLVLIFSEALALSLEKHEAPTAE